MKRLIFVFVLIGIVVTGYCQQKKNEVRWRDLQGMTFTAGTNFSISGSYPSWTFTPSLTPTFTTVSVGSQTLSQVNTNKAVFNNSLKITDTLFLGGSQWIRQVTINKIGIEGSLSTGANDTIITGRVEATNINASGNITCVLPAYFDSTIYFGSSAGNVWMPFMVPQVGTPRYRADLQNIGDIKMQAKNGLSQVLAIQRDTSLTESGVNHLNVVKQVYLGKDTTGIGSTANIGTTLYYNGHFYGLIAGTPPVWKQLDN